MPLWNPKQPTILAPTSGVRSSAVPCDQMGHLPTVADLANRYSVALGTARRAVAELRSTVLVTVSRGRRAAVADPVGNGEQLAEIVSLLLLRGDAGKTPSGVHEIGDVLSSESTRLAAPLLALHQAGSGHIARFTSELGESLLKVLSLEQDYSRWLEIVDGRPESRELSSSHRDFGLALYAASAGVYRQAFAGLRSFLEVAVATIRLSASEFERRQWVSGRRDISWNAVISDDEGIYSRAFLQEFCPDALEESGQYLKDLKVCYRRCSEYLHGAVSTSALLPERLDYVAQIGSEWLGLAETGLYALHHCMFVRYFAELTVEDVSKIEPGLEQHLGHVRSIRIALGLPVEEQIS